MLWAVTRIVTSYPGLPDGRLDGAACRGREFSAFVESLREQLRFSVRDDVRGVLDSANLRRHPHGATQSVQLPMTWTLSVHRL